MRTCNFTRVATPSKIAPMGEFCTFLGEGGDEGGSAGGGEGGGGGGGGGISGDAG